jgi:excisionase family DNA binding protein
LVEIYANHGAPVVRLHRVTKNEARSFLGIPLETTGFVLSGRQDLNLRPLGPEPGSGHFAPGTTDPHDGKKPLSLLGMTAGAVSTGCDAPTLFSTWFGPNLGHDSRATNGWESPRPLLKVEEVAARLRVSRATVYKLIKDGRLAHVRVSGFVRVPEAALRDIEAGGRR